MTTFLFANVIASGIKIVVGEFFYFPACLSPWYLLSMESRPAACLCDCTAAEHLSRRNRFIMACSLGLGIGVTLYPQW